MMREVARSLSTYHPSFWLRTSSSHTRSPYGGLMCGRHRRVGFTRDQLPVPLPSLGRYHPMHPAASARLVRSRPCRRLKRRHLHVVKLVEVVVHPRRRRASAALEARHEGISSTATKVSPQQGEGPATEPARSHPQLHFRIAAVSELFTYSEAHVASRSS